MAIRANREVNLAGGSSITTTTDYPLSGQGGAGGTIRIQTERLGLAEGSLLTAESTNNGGRAGSILLETQNLRVASGSGILATTTTGQAGDIAVNPGQGLTGKGTITGMNSRLTAEASAGGIAGNIALNLNQLTVEAGAAVSVRSPQGQAGNLTVQAAIVDLNRGTLSATTATSPATGEAGANIELAGLELLLLLRDRSTISASALDTATGGNIRISAPEGFVVAAANQNSDITASAIQGRGGSIDITAQGIYNLAPRPAQPANFTNDIDASSEFGESGTVTINDPTVDPSRARTELPESVLDAGNLIDRSCQADAGQNRSSLVVTGRGGVPPTPQDVVQSTPSPQPDLGTDSTLVVMAASPAASPAQFQKAAPEPLIEARTWYRDASGAPVLTAQVAAPETNIATAPVFCPAG
ncbi:hypothetical protein C7271_25510 [filamentous cyanobacterium CCP5]|nr:hypothetical protein C7271_25510 [filamentous cyanobacterium CCP5]